MNRFAPAQLVVIACLVVFASTETPGQPPETNRIESELQAGRSRIRGERVSRQVEVIRLEKAIERLQERVTRLERLSLRTTQFPAITVMEAEAELRYAESQLEESARLHEKGELSEARVASGRLSVVRARAQLEIARARIRTEPWHWN
ncbi:MAG: hypothetical protein CMJ64_25280 [Planctomycetaceae bacterium]|nr:hypothetical protein [Planctomycetaceae bacterium]